MKFRCSNPNHVAFARYGGRGIRVVERWETFANFLADMGERPPGTSLDRIDNDGDYTPQNCRWATARQQQSNTIKVRRLDYQGHTASLAEWARKVGIRESTLRERLRRGWDVGRALTAPLRGAL